MRAITILTLSLLLGSNIQAQVPGYLGKKLAIGYNLDVGFPVFRNPDFRGGFLVTNNYKGEEISYFSFYPRHNLTLEFVVGKQLSLEASYGQSKSGLFSYENEFGLLSDEYPELSAELDGPPTNSQKAYDYLRVNNQLFKIGMNFFLGDYVAPHGSYVNFSYIQNVGTVQYVFNNEAKDLARITNHGGMITYGIRRILYSSFIIDFGFGMGGAIGDLSGLTQEESTEYSSDDTPITLSRAQTVALNNSILINGHLSVKYLLPRLRKPSKNF